jgi:ATP-dependent exoDNAse (exonuclease V) beta subunit
VADITELLIEDGCKDKDCDLLIMAKTNSVLNVVKEKFKHTPKNRLMTKSGVQLDIRFETFHRSKGLEARYCLLIEDCHYDNEHPTKNYLYKLAGFSKSFDDAQREESMRLAYVAVTRAKEKVWWITAEESKGSFQLAKAYAMEKGYAF